PIVQALVPDSQVGGGSSPADGQVGGGSSPADGQVGGGSSPADGQVGGRSSPADAPVLVAFAPDGRTDAALAPALARARVVYVSTTGVYGRARGHVDETTAVDPSEPRAADRLAAERAYRDLGATVLRAAGIYGPWRGLHRRLLGGDFKIP